MPIYANSENNNSRPIEPLESFWFGKPETIALLENIKEQKEECTYCKELAKGLNAIGRPVCGIPKNHPPEDDIVV